MRKCLHCNSPMTFDDNYLIYICDYCGREYTLDDITIELSDCVMEEEEE